MSIDAMNCQCYRRIISVPSFESFNRLLLYSELHDAQTKRHCLPDPLIPSSSFPFPLATVTVVGNFGSFLHGVLARGALGRGLLGVVLGALLQLVNGLVGAAVGLDSLLAVRGELGLPVALAGFLLGEGVLLVLVVVLVLWGILNVSE